MPQHLPSVFLAPQLAHEQPWHWQAPAAHWHSPPAVQVQAAFVAHWQVSPVQFVQAHLPSAHWHWQSLAWQHPCLSQHGPAFFSHVAPAAWHAAHGASAVHESHLAPAFTHGAHDVAFSAAGWAAASSAVIAGIAQLPQPRNPPTYEPPVKA